MSATGRGKARNHNDFYETPNWCTELIMPNINWSDGLVIDAGSGNGAIGRVLAQSGLNVVGIESNPELAHTSYPQEQMDYLTCTYLCRTTISNPPYSKSLEFVTRALLYSTSVVMLLRLNWLASQRRKRLLTCFPPEVKVLSKRPSFTGNGTDATEYAWFCWGPEFKPNMWSLL